jgi:hypothetical protein
MEAISRRWTRRLKIAVLLVVVMSGAGLGLSIAMTILSQAVPLPLAHAPSQLAPVRALVAAEPPADLTALPMPDSTPGEAVTGPNGPAQGSGASPSEADTAAPRFGR